MDGDNFGSGVALLGGTAIFGHPLIGVRNSGSAYIVNKILTFICKCFMLKLGWLGGRVIYLTYLVSIFCLS